MHLHLLVASRVSTFLPRLAVGFFFSDGAVAEVALTVLVAAFAVVTLSGCAVAALAFFDLVCGNVMEVSILII